MTTLQLAPNELLIGQGMAAYWEPVLGGSCTTWRGTIFVTNQRVCFSISWTNHLEFELRLPKIDGFEVGRHLFYTKVIICGKAGERFMITGFPIKKIQGWLRQVGIRQL